MARQRQPQIIRSLDGMARTAPKTPLLRRIRRGFKRYKKSPAMRAIYVLAVVVVIAGIVFAVSLLRPKPDQANVDVVVSEVGRHMVLPTNEKPVLATVTDKKKVGSPFLKKADNGDKILIYANAKRVIIYRPSIDRIIDVGPVEIGTPAAAEQGTQ